MPTKAEHQPLLSLAITARNDSYMGDFKWRLVTALNYLALNASAIGRLDDVEVMVCDWGSDVPLHEDLKLQPEASAITRFVVVPPELARQLQGDSTFPDCLVYNAAVRRSTGRFVGVTGSDVLFPAASLLAMLAALEGKIPGLDPNKAVMLIARRHVPVHFIQRQPSVRDLMAYVDRNATFFPPDTGGVGTGAPSNMILMPRDMWFDSHGIDERYIHWGWSDIDHVLRCSQFFPLVYLDHYGVHLLHMEHWKGPRSYSPSTMFRKMNKPHDTPAFVANTDNWGLADHDLPICRSASVVAEVEPDPQPGTTETWPESMQELVAEILDAKHTQFVQTLFQSTGIQYDQAELTCLVGLEWYAARKQPRTYVEASFRYPHAACVVARAAPGVEIYGLVLWQRLPGEEQFFGADGSFAFLANNFLRQVGQHWAYTRFIGGDPATQVQRLRDSSPGRLCVDLALVRAAPHAVEQALELAALLSPGGAMIVNASDQADFQVIWSALMAKYPSFTYMDFTDHRNGIVLAAQLRARG